MDEQTGARAETRTRGTLIDEVTIFVRAGGGGNGAVSFRREKFVPRGGPDGGDGGRGGDILLKGSRGLNTLLPFTYHSEYRAESGGGGRGSRQHGKRGKDLVIEVPLGTVAYDEQGPIADVTMEGQQVPVARGGKGGIGNVHFATSTNQAPRTARKGEPGEERHLKLELKTIGDVGLVGEPNAGKSSLLAAMSAAHPEVGEYPFTTLAPNLGVATVEDVPFVVVDMPGLIEGAHMGIGLGYRFLRHVERAPLLVHVVDAAAPDAFESYLRVRNELRIYDPLLVSRTLIVAANKLDLAEARSGWELLRSRIYDEGNQSVHSVSAVTGEGLVDLLVDIRQRLEALREQDSLDETQVRVYRLPPEDKGFSVQKASDGFSVVGRSVERVLAMADMDSDEGLADLQRQLERLGVLKALEEAGVKSGDTVRAADFEMEWT